LACLALSSRRPAGRRDRELFDVSRRAPRTQDWRQPRSGGVSGLLGCFEICFDDISGSRAGSGLIQDALCGRNPGSVFGCCLAAAVSNAARSSGKLATRAANSGLALTADIPALTKGSATAAFVTMFAE